MQNKPKLRFPAKFLWGASVSAHQVEGGNHNQWSVWELEHAKAKAAQAPHVWNDLEHWPDIKNEATKPENYVSGMAVDHFNRYEEDFDWVKKMRMNAFRFSVEWSRIEPEEGAWNAAAIEHYKKYVAALRKRNIEPMVTLFHFTLPVWFAAKGGFEKRANVKYFTRFAEKIVSELGIDIRYVITINEPEIYATESYLRGNWPPMKMSKRSTLSVLNNLAYAHNKAADAIHKLNRRYKVSVAKHSSFIYPGDDAVLSRKSAAIMQYLRDDWFLKKVTKRCDFLGVNYYASDRIYGYRMHNPNERLSDLGWDMSPGDIQFVLERLYRKYKLPIIVTENGLADAGDEHRSWWLTQTLLGMQGAMKEGVELEGYFHWSLVDNFEWDKGFWPRFGLLEVDRTAMKRRPRPSAVKLARVLNSLQE